MGFLDILARYAQSSGSDIPEASADFEHVARHAPSEDLAHGIAEAFRADETPPFEQMVGQLFGRSDPQQRAGMLNEILHSLGPGVAGGLGGGILGSILQRGARSVSPHEAAEVRPGEVEDLAREAARHNPGIIERVSRYYAQNPQLFQTLGSVALSIAMSRMGRRRAA
jgi:hypothetical protein